MRKRVIILALFLLLLCPIKTQAASFFRPVETMLAGEGAKAVKQIKNAEETSAFLSLSDAYKAHFQLSDYLCSFSYLRVKDDTTLEVTNVPKVRERIRKAEKYYRKIYKKAKKLYRGNNRKTNRRFCRYLRWRYSYKGWQYDPFGERRLGNCIVYSVMYQRMCYVCRIPCEIYAGWALGGQGHCWNRVRIKKTWYWCDACWFGVSNKKEYLRSKDIWRCHKAWKNLRTYIPNVPY